MKKTHAAVQAPPLTDPWLGQPITSVKTLSDLGRELYEREAGRDAPSFDSLPKTEQNHWSQQARA